MTVFCFCAKIGAAKREMSTVKKRLWNKDFILLFQGSAVSTVGDLMYSVAIGYWVFEKTGSNSLMGIILP